MKRGEKEKSSEGRKEREERQRGRKRSNGGSRDSRERETACLRKSIKRHER